MKIDWKLINTSFDINFIKEVGSILGEGSFGSVQEIITTDGSKNTFTMKTQILKSMDDVRIFENELNVGSNNLLKSKFIGPSIYAYSLYTHNNTRYGVYIMDHWERGLKNVKSTTLLNYLNKFDKCPLPKSDIIYSIEHLLLSFYKITKGYHGDLHTSNIAVVFTDKKPHKILYLQIFDYGAHQKLSISKLNKCFSLKNVLNLIQKEFNNDLKKRFNIVHTNVFPKDSNVRVLYPELGQPYRSNLEMLKYVNKLTGVSKENNISLYKSLIH